MVTWAEINRHLFLTESPWRPTTSFIYLFLRFTVESEHQQEAQRERKSQADPALSPSPTQEVDRTEITTHPGGSQESGALTVPPRRPITTLITNKTIFTLGIADTFNKQ